MASEIKLWLTIFVQILVSKLQQCVLGVPQVTCYFIFGDSLVDNGNNNHLETIAKANYSPYGIDFPNGPTGRFCNGATSFDIIANLLGFDNYIPPFATAGDSDILKGVNYASAAPGIREETGKISGDRISLNRQLLNHIQTITRISAKLGSNDSAAQYLNKCLYSVGMGSNDYINNYFMPLFYPTSILYNLEQYAQVLIDQYCGQLKNLYEFGARKIALFGLGLVGCTPNAIRSYPTNGASCVEKMNNAVQLFNKQLKSLVDQLNSNLTNAKFIYVNIYGIMSDCSASSSCFRVSNKACCQVWDIYGTLCLRNRTPCQNRNEYAFWDGFHPTEAFNKMIAQRSYNAFDPSDAYPYDVSHLAQL